MFPNSPLHPRINPGLLHAETLLIFAVFLPVCKCVVEGVPSSQTLLPAALTELGRPALLLQHHAWGFRSRSLLPGPVARRPRQALQLWRPGDMDPNRCLADWSWLCGTSGRLFVHLAVVMSFREQRVESFVWSGHGVRGVFMFLMYSICTWLALMKVK